MEDKFKIVAAVPDAFSEDQRARFRELVVQGGEVAGVVLSENIENARALVMLWHDGVVRGVAALKRPQASYRKRVGVKAEYNLPEENFPYELGYVFIDKALQGRRLSHPLVSEALDHGDRLGIFATVRTDNAAMRKALARAGFVAEGMPYAGRQNRMIGIMVRAPQ